MNRIAALAVCLLVLGLGVSCSEQEAQVAAPRALPVVRDFKNLPLAIAMRDNAPPQQMAPTIHDASAFFATTSHKAADKAGYAFSFDDREILLSSDASGVFNAYAVSAKDGAQRQLTESTTSAVYAVTWFPADHRMLFTSDQDGNELHHIHVREEDGRTRDLTPGQKLKAIFVGWSGDGRSLWIATNERDARRFDLYRYDPKDYSRELVFLNDQDWQLDGVSRDSHWLALTRINSNHDSDIYLVDLTAQSAASSKPVLITPHQKPARHAFASFDPLGHELYYLTDAVDEFLQVWTHDLETREQSQTVVDMWDVREYSYSWTGKFLQQIVNANARNDAAVMDMSYGQPVRIPRLGYGGMGDIHFSRDETAVAFLFEGDTRPADLYVMELNSTPSPRRLTTALNPEIQQSDLVSGLKVTFKSFDGLTIPGILYLPVVASAEYRVAALVLVHGGPGGQNRSVYRAFVQHLVNHGYAILAVNNRGSSGYGKTFFHLDDRKHGEVDLQDVVAGAVALRGLPWIDPEKIGVIGGSYGGYMVAAAMAFEPDAFEVGIDIFGVTNWVRTLKSIPPWWNSFRKSLYEEMGDPAVDQERHRRISPLFHAENIRKPLLVVQGANDPRVLQVESDELVAAVRKNGAPVEYLLFADEGHGFRKRDNRIAASNAYVRFLDKYLDRNGQPPATEKVPAE